jgi:formylglycine-generating enzyme required for sulfatase activity
MARSGYGTVGGRRSGSAAWQWIIIGGVLGFGCSAVLVLGLLTAGILNLDSGEDEAPTVAATSAAALPMNPQPTVNVQATIEGAIAATLAAQPTDAPQPTATVGIQVVPPTATPIPTTDIDLNLDDPTAQPTSASAGLFTESQETDEVPFRSIATNLLPIDGGTFQMGTTITEVGAAVRECVEEDGGNCIPEYGTDSIPQHSVTLDPYFIEEHEVTNEQFIAFLQWLGPNSHRDGCFNQQCAATNATLENSPITFDGVNYDTSPIFASLPAVGVTWYGARAYCEALERRLPTEAEWEYAARGTDSRVYPWGFERNLQLMRTSRPEGTIGPVEVSSYPLSASPWGATEMAGNVAEWVADWYQPNFYNQPASGGLNPTGPFSGTDRVIRGGSWDALPFFARAVHRQHERPEEANLWLGFRCAADVDTPVGDVQPQSTTSVLDPANLGPTEPGADTVPTEPPVDAAPTLAPASTQPPAAEPTQSDTIPPVGNQ